MRSRAAYPDTGNCLHGSQFFQRARCQGHRERWHAGGIQQMFIIEHAMAVPRARFTGVPDLRGGGHAGRGEGCARGLPE